MSEGRHRPPPKSRKLNPAVAVVPAVLVVVGLIAFFVFRGGDGTGGGIFGGGEDDTIPGLELRTVKAVAIPTSQTEPKELAGPAAQVADAVTQEMHDLYTAAFLDPGNWRDGEYDAVWEMFDPSAQATAQQSVDTLTLGSTAGDAYDELTRPRGKVTVKVLMGPDDQPATAVAIVTFTVNAKGKDGTFTEVVSNGEYFLKQTGDGWTIYSFSVGRKDHEVVPTPGPSASPPAVAS